MVHITVFYINLYAYKSYLIDVDRDADSPETPLTLPNSKSWKIHWIC